MSVKIISLNVRGIRNEIKRRTIFNYCRDRADISCLMETHSDEKSIKSWILEWGGKMIYAHGETDSKGVCILFKRGLDINITKTVIDENGRFAAAKITYNSCDFMLCSTYAPNKDNPQFFVDLVEKTFDISENRIFIGDFNVTMEAIDRRGLGSNNEKACEVLHEIMTEMNLTEIWRDRNPGVQTFSYQRRKPTIAASRIDYALISRGFDNQIASCFYIPSIRTDHRSFFMSIHFSDHQRGRGYWKFNDSMLRNETFVQELLKNLEQKVQVEYAQLPKKEKWELLKRDAMIFSQQKAIEHAGEKRLIISQLYEKVNELQTKLDKQYQESTDDLLRRTQSDLEELENEKTLGIMFRSKARWHCEAERNTSYFYALEKSRASAKTTTVLIDEKGKRVTDQKSILNMQKVFYKKL